VKLSCPVDKVAFAVEPATFPEMFPVGVTVFVPPVEPKDF
jgi:hypothetical protein